uniref:Uncharacterized protein n=1 Tax=Anguilla anguilla TaxID=7936 RepID=A0A0E9WV36_ANGAN
MRFWYDKGDGQINVLKMNAKVCSLILIGHRCSPNQWNDDVIRAICPSNCNFDTVQPTVMYVIPLYPQNSVLSTGWLASGPPCLVSEQQ